jgi:hypothetical protein
MTIPKLKIDKKRRWVIKIGAQEFRFMFRNEAEEKAKKLLEDGLWFINLEKEATE